MECCGKPGEGMRGTLQHPLLAQLALGVLPSCRSFLQVPTCVGIAVYKDKYAFQDVVSAGNG